MLHALFNKQKIIILQDTFELNKFGPEYISQKINQNFQKKKIKQAISYHLLSFPCNQMLFEIEMG